MFLKENIAYTCYSYTHRDWTTVGGEMKYALKFIASAKQTQTIYTFKMKKKQNKNREKKIERIKIRQK